MRDPGGDGNVLILAAEVNILVVIWYYNVVRYYL